MDAILPEPTQYFVRDIMTRDIVKVMPDGSVSAIALLMSQHRISGVPVVDEQDRVLGVVTELDMIVRNTRFKLPAFFTLLNATIYLENSGPPQGAVASHAWPHSPRNHDREGNDRHGGRQHRGFGRIDGRTTG